MRFDTLITIDCILYPWDSAIGVANSEASAYQLFPMFTGMLLLYEVIGSRDLFPKHSPSFPLRLCYYSMKFTAMLTLCSFLT